MFQQSVLAGWLTDWAIKPFFTPEKTAVQISAAVNPKTYQPLTALC